MPRDQAPTDYDMLLEVVAELVNEEVAPLKAQVKSLEAQVAAYEATPGPAGPQGAPGPAGPQGERGMDGKDGEAGPQGEKGMDGADGAQGVPGPQGEKGLDGETGPVGPKGSYGIDGMEGPQGAPGPAGPQGEKGPDGKDGPAGPQGEKGMDGADAPPPTNLQVLNAARAMYPDMRKMLINELPAIEHKGVWTAEYGEYQPGDEVIKNDSTYRAKHATLEAPPHDDWQCIAKSKIGRRGATGEIGPEGPKGVGLSDIAAEDGHLFFMMTNEDTKSFDLRPMLEEMVNKLFTDREGED